MYRKPKQRLPVPCLVSPENGTGKTTFLRWLNMIYSGNGVILNNDRFKMNFNGHYASKFIIGLDEGFLEVEKKAEKEKLKQLVTSDTIFLENKGMDIKEIPYYGKLIICSNDADRLMKIDEGETRWFIVRVHPFEEEDPFMEEKIQKEIPAWLSFLENRKIHHKQEGRLWFKPEHFETEQFRKIVEVTKNRLESILEEYLKDMFLMYKLPVLRLDTKTILESLNDPKFSKYKIDEKDLRYHLKERLQMKSSEPIRLKIPINLLAERGGTSLSEPEVIFDNSRTARTYEFRYDDWLDAEEQEMFLKPWSETWNVQFDKDESGSGQMKIGASQDKPPF